MSKAKFGEWTKVEDALPKHFESVIGAIELDNEPMVPGEVYLCPCGKWDSVRSGYEVTKITHWMPMPLVCAIAKAEGRA